jgi:hypothetical protein
MFQECMFQIRERLLAFSTHSIHALLLLAMLFAAQPCCADDIAPATPSYTCSRLTNDTDDENQCYDVIRGRQFDDFAVGMCNAYQNDDTTVTCMETIAGKSFNHDAVAGCNLFGAETDKNGCLAVIVNKDYTASQVATCNADTDAPSTDACFERYGVPMPPPAALAWNEKTRSCELVSSKTGAFIAKRTPADCLKDPNTEFVWIDGDSRTCAAFSANNEFIDFVDNSNCAGAGLQCLKGSGILSSVNTALIGGTLYHLVPEILQLRDGQTVPSDDYKKYSSDLIAASLVERMHDWDERAANVAQPSFDYQSGTLLQMKFNDNEVTSILKSGFLNQHQIGHSDGLYSPARRAQVEDSLIGVHLESQYQPGVENPVNGVRPKYSFLAFDNDPDGQHYAHFSRDYGNIVAVFKDEIKDRTTFTPVDSLVSVEHLGSVKSYTTAYRSAQPIKKITIAKDFGDYWEAQIWGQLSVGDVSYFLVNCPGDQPVAASSLATLEKTNIPVYQCAFVPDHSHFEKGKLLSPGDPAHLPPSAAPSGTDTSQFQTK